MEILKIKEQASARKIQKAWKQHKNISTNLPSKSEKIKIDKLPDRKITEELDL